MRCIKNGAPCGTPFSPASHDSYAVKFTQRIGLGEVCGIISVKVEDGVVKIVGTLIGFVQIKSCLSPFGKYLCFGSAVHFCGVCLTWLGCLAVENHRSGICEGGEGNLSSAYGSVIQIASVTHIYSGIIQPNVVIGRLAVKCIGIAIVQSAGVSFSLRIWKTPAPIGICICNII